MLHLLWVMTSPGHQKLAGPGRTTLEWRSSKPAAFGLCQVDNNPLDNNHSVVHDSLFQLSGPRAMLRPIVTGPCILRIMSRDGKEERSPTLMSSLAQELPWDILQEVFTQALFPALREGKTTQTEQTMRLCQICSHWRTVMLGSSAIWQYIECKVTYRPSDNLEMLPKRDGFNFLAGPARIANIDLLKWWLKNLGSYIGPHIEVFTKYKRVESGQVSKTFNDDHALFFLQLLSSARSLHVDFDFSCDLDVWLNSRKDVFKNLEEIYIGPMPVDGLHDRWKRNHGTFAIPILISNLKSLRSITFTPQRDIIWSPASDVEYQPLWDLLTHVQIEGLGISVPEWATFIRGFTALQYGCFTVHFRGWVPADVNSPLVMCLPHLLELKMRWPGYTNAAVNPLQNLKLPALEGLHLSVPEPITITVINQILRSTSRLLRLCVDGRQFPYSRDEPENVEPLWSYVPRLEELFLTYSAPYTWPKRFRRLWIEKLLTSHWLGLHKPGENFRLLKIYQEFSKTDEDYVSLRAVIDKHMKVQERSYSICLQENWRFSELNDFKFTYWPHN
jgi:hypothetical protein